MASVPPKTTGVWPAQLIHDAINQGYVRPHGDSPPVPPSNVQPASLDLRLGEVAHLLQCSFIPGAETVSSKLQQLSMGQVRLDSPDGAILHKDQAYLIPLMEELALPDFLKARANPKSSTGRLDIFTRIITDHGHQFDEVKDGYHGRLYLELVSRTFTIKVKSGLSLNQIRFIQGNPHVSPQKILQRRKNISLLYEGDRPLDMAKHQAINDDGILLSVDLKGSPTAAPIGYKARAHATLLDLSVRTKYRPEDFWEEIKPDRSGRLILEPEVFYLLISWEKVRIPEGYAAEMAAYEPTSGELRTHYAGFFDPGFGVWPDRMPQGTKAVMEVRARDVAFMIEHKQKVCKLRFEQMAANPEILYGPQIGSFYQGQNLILSKHFLPASSLGQQIPVIP